MHVIFEVVNPRIEEELSVSDINFTHVGCGPASHRRDMATGEHRLNCGCGLEVRFAPHGVASSTIIDVTIDEQPRNLPANSYFSSPDALIRIVHAA